MWSFASSRWRIGLLVAASVALCLAPWLRNHGFLRDFYDYGLIINGSARLEAGQRLFVDFVTPAQSALFALNRMAESLGGNTYIGMTRGAAVLIALAAVALTLVLARRLPPLLAAVSATAIVACSASQHTLIFYNPIGVLAMALVVWSFAVAPLLRREHLGWHLVAGFGLVLGGLNKINFHLLTCGIAVGWIGWSVIESRQSWLRVLASVAFVLLCGIVLPVAIELAWTGADFQTWYYNVVQLPLGARGGRVSLLANPQVYFSTLHDYYGPLRLPHSGLVVMLLPLLAVPAAWAKGTESRPWLRRAFVVVASVCGALAGAALLLTNNEIVYLSVAASLVILLGLWLRFGLPTRGPWVWGAIGVPALFVGACGWESAWLGQRSQFGHITDPRSSYVLGETIGSEFGYLRGLAVPAGLAESLAQFAERRKSLGKEADAVFYGPGVEWLERVWPAPKVRGMPLVAAAFESEREAELLDSAVIEGGPFRHILVAEAWNNWSPPVQETLKQRFTMERVRLLFLYHKLRPGVLWSRPLEFPDDIGGNVESTRLISQLPRQRLADGRRFLGTAAGEGELEVDAPSYRISGEAVVRRAEPSGRGGPVVVAVYALHGDARYPRWRQEISLPEGVDELVVPTGQIDASGLGAVFTVQVADGAGVIAGWREPRLWNAVGAEEKPPLIQQGAVRADSAPDDFQAALLPDAMAGAAVFVREARLTDGKCWLPGEGEIWIRLPAIFSAIEISARNLSGPTDVAPQLRVIYYKGGRIESFHPNFDSQSGVVRYRAWSPEAGGWLAVLAAPNRAIAPFELKIERAERQP